MKTRQIYLATTTKGTPIALGMSLNSIVNKLGARSGIVKIWAFKNPELVRVLGEIKPRATQVREIRKRGAPSYKSMG